MGGIFQKIRERVHKNALIKSGLLGSIVGLTTAAALLFASAFVSSVSPLLALIGLATGALTFAIAYLLYYKNDKRLAKSLDTKLCLNERVQTMLEFKDTEGDMYVLQREEAAEKLSAVPAEHFKIRKLWWYLAALLLAAVLAIGSAVTVVIRGSAEDEIPGEEIEEPYEMSDWQQAALAELIQEVKASALLDYVKEPLVIELETLLAALPDITVQNVMKANVKTTIKNVDNIVEDLNSYKAIYYALVESEHPLVLAFADLIADSNASTFNRGLTEIKNAKDDTDVPYFVDATDKAVLKQNLGDFASALKEGLITVTAVEEDPLYPAVLAFADELIRISRLSDAYGLGSIVDEMDKAFADASEAISNAIYEQELNESWRTRIIRRLQEIFGISNSELPNLSQGIINGGGGNDSDKPPENDQGNGGGAGEGGILAGSDSLVYDPNTNEQVHYLTILDDYYANVVAQMNAGTISEELAKCLIAYYTALYNGAAMEDKK